MHIPNEDKKTLAAVEQYMADEYWDYYINLGDFLDFNCISRFTENLPGRREGETVEKDYQAANAVLDRHCRAARRKNKNCKIYFIEGNHDYRPVAFVEHDPRLKGTLDVDKNLRLKERGIKWVRFHSKGELIKIGKATFIHGRYTNKYHAFKHVDSYYGWGVFYGHTHDVQEYGKVLHGYDKTVKGKSLGCLCDYSQRYLRGSPTNWQQAFSVFWFFKDGYFQDVTVPIFKHRFIGPTNGKIYDGKKAK